MAPMPRDGAKMESLVRRLSSEERVVIRVNDIIIKGNTRTSHSLVAAEVEPIFREASSLRQLLLAAAAANARLKHLGLFHSVTITLDAGPPGTVNVVVEVSEAKNRLTGDLEIYCQPEVRSNSVEGSLKLKNLFGFGDLWDGSVAYGWGQASEISMGLSLPKFKGLATPLSARISLRSQDWLKFSSHRERVLGLSLGLLSTGNHDVSYNLSWRSLTDPSQLFSETLSRQLGHNLFSALKYAFKVDQRDSATRPTRGHAFASTTQIGGLLPDIQSFRLIRQEFDLRCAIPLGIYRAAFNFGISGGIIFPWGSGYLNAPSYLPERFFMGGNSSPVSSLRGPTSVLGFKARGLGPAEPRELVGDNSSDRKSETDHIGGDLALTAFADLSFDLPLKVLQEAGVHGHIFACTGSLNKLSANAYKEFSFQKFQDSFRSSAGFGIIIPTKLFRMEVNYCHILKQHEHDCAKTGLQFNFSGLQ
ncbi:Outer membrane OMP85 family protein [Perilla frutescens var. frutescens]|nr:Outer membrane OMP85 family protein [Perilla frutescens var. frutescens]